MRPLSDTAAVLEIARLMKLRVPDLIASARKIAPLKLIKNSSTLLLSETYGGVPCNLVVAPIAIPTGILLRADEVIE